MKRQVQIRDNHLSSKLRMINKIFTFGRLILMMILGLFFKPTLQAQVVNSGVADTISGNKLGNVSIGAYMDLYYGFDFNKPKDGNIPYFVSMNRHNEANINLAMLDVRFKSERLRARMAPGFGTYMQANYATESSGLRYLIEANAGIRLFKSKDIWLDFGILGSPFTNESCVSRDHLMYTRSFAPEYVPYYLSGLKLSIPINIQWNLYVYLLNGWQQITDQNTGKSFSAQIEFRPDDKNLLNWDIYIGDERSTSNPDYRMRYFTDLYWIYNPDGKFSLTSCAYMGLQEKQALTKNIMILWWQANICGRYKLGRKTSVSGRLEYFNDANAVQISSINAAVSGFSTFGGGLCLNYSLFENALIRFEGRQLYVPDKVYKSFDDKPSSTSTWFTGNLTIWF